jgi:hypothetical protein
VTSEMIVPEGVELAIDVSPADWVVERLWPWDRQRIRIGTFAPEGFEGYARIQHPEEPAQDVIGLLPRKQLLVLRTVLEPFTRTPERCWYCVWAGYGALSGGTMLRLVPRGLLPRLRAEWRMKREADRKAERDAELTASIPQVEGEGEGPYFLFQGPLNEAALEFDNDYRPPNIWWPDDRAWCVATGIDFSWTYVEASRVCIDRILTSPDLDTREVSIDVLAVDPSDTRG